MRSPILVTGASGFIGRPLAEALERAGYTVIRHRRADGDLASADLPDCGASHVCHLAARTSVVESWSQPQPFYATNVLGTVNVLEFCRRRGASLTFLSSYVYGHPQRLPIAEDHPLAAFNPYAHSKLLAEEACRYYAAQFAIPVTIVRPFNVYGPGQADEFLIPSILRQVMDPRQAAVSLADDRPRRDYVHVDDLIALLVGTIGRPGLDVFNAGSGASVSSREIARQLLAAAGVDKPIVSRGEQRPDDVLDTVADITHAARVLGWTPRIPLADGLRALVRG